MSEVILRVIPDDPEFVPSEDARSAALRTFASHLGENAETTVKVFDEIAFIDQGGNFESVSCPRCGRQIDTGWWTQAMDTAYESRFSARASRTPCCENAVDLNDLVYVWPAGFARFVLEARSPGLSGDLGAEAVAALEDDLGCPVRQIWARY